MRLWRSWLRFTRRVILDARSSSDYMYPIRLEGSVCAGGQETRKTFVVSSFNHVYVLDMKHYPHQDSRPVLGLR